MSYGTIRRFTGTGSPNGVLTAPPTSVYEQTDAAEGSRIWFKDSGLGNTGWYLRGSGSGAEGYLDTSGYLLIDLEQDEHVDTITLLKNMSGMITGTVVVVLGYYAAGSGGGGVFRYNSTSSATDDGGMIIAPTSGIGRWERQLSNKRIVDAQMFGARYDGTTDDTTAHNNAASYLNALGGGKLIFGAGRTIVGTIIVYDKVEYQGQGWWKTHLQIKDTVNGAVFQSLDFATLTGTSSNAGQHDFAIRDLSIDARRNHTSQSATYGIRLFGWGFELANLRIGYSKSHGLVTEWGGLANPPLDPGSDIQYMMESVFSNIKIVESDADGFVFDGPHDAKIYSVISSGHAGTGINIKDGADWFACHAWGDGIAFDVSWNGNHFYGCQAEGNTTGPQVRFLSGPNSWYGGKIFGGLTGVQIGNASFTNFAGVYVDSMVEALTGAALSWQSGITNARNWIKLRGRSGAASAESGTAPANADVQIDIESVATYRRTTVPLAPPKSATAPSSPFDGMTYLDISVGPNCIRTYNGLTSTWYRVAYMPTGTTLSGAWQAGDKIWYTNPTASASPGQICRVSGTTGTWSAMANLGA